MNRKIRLANRGLLETGDRRAGSAIIIAVVLTSLLAIVGVMFLMMSRVDKIATSAVSENKDLDSAVETVVAKISQELVLDIPGKPKGVDYYDYPDADNAWLASLEPYYNSGYKWRQISDVYEKLVSNIDLGAAIILDYQANVSQGQPADADGDGVADSKWVELDDMVSSKGKPIYAAIRVIDNGGMMNVNTAYKFDPNSAGQNDIDGSSQMQMNLDAFSWGRYHTTYNSSAVGDLLDARANYGVGVNPVDLDAYEQNVIWRYNEPNGNYTPFDISDELELRYRFLINQDDIDSRLEVLGVPGWSWEFRTIYDFRTPAEDGDLPEWFISSYDSGILDPNYAYRHIATTYNMDRIINPNGNKMININRADAGSIYGVVKSVLDPNIGPDSIAAQITANLIDYTDGPGYPVSDPRFDPNNDVTVVHNDSDVPFYGFEQPCIYISELAHRFLVTEGGGGPAQSDVWRSYAIELYKPYSGDAHPELNRWRLVIDGINYNIEWPGTQQFHVVEWGNPNTALDIDPGASLQYIENNYSEIFRAGSNISLRRCIDEVNDVWISVDSHGVSVIGSVGWLMAEEGTPFSIQRDINPHKCIRRLWASPAEAGAPQLGLGNSYSGGGAQIQAHPANAKFTNIGEIGMLLRKSAYAEGTNQIGPSDTEDTARLDLTDADFQKLFEYLTVFDPTTDGIDNDGDSNGIGLSVDDDELKVPGRININTAPWFVLAQLPWMQYKAAGNDYLRAQAVVTDRDLNGVFKNVAELMRMPEMLDLGVDSSDNSFPGGPDITPDSAQDDFEERDVIFARISNLISVRSDVFTAYILVRIGTDGPQKRVMAILDRSNVYPTGGKVKIIALHPVPDPR